MLDKSHWESKIRSLGKLRHSIPYQRSFGPDEILKLAGGLLAQEMDDRWVVLLHEASLDFYRSWTGNCIFSLPLQFSSDKVQAGPLLVNANEEEYRTIDAKREIELVDYLISETLDQPPLI